MFFSCEKYTYQNNFTKEQRTGSQGTFWYAGAASASANGDQGLSADVDVIKLQGGSFYMKSVWISFYFVDQNDGRTKWTQWGYGLNSQLGYITIIQEFDGSTQLNPGITYLNSVPFVFDQKMKFSVYNVSGTTKWRYAKNGIDVNEIDLGATAISNNVSIQLESQSSSYNVKWPLINVKNISSLHNGIWTNLATSSYQGHFINGVSIWRIEGKNQNPLLSSAELNMGGNGQGVAPNSIFW